MHAVFSCNQAQCSSGRWTWTLSGLAVPGSTRAASGCLMRFRSASIGKPRKSSATVVEGREAGRGAKGSFQSVALPSGSGEWNHLCLGRAHTHTETDRQTQADRYTHAHCGTLLCACMCVGGGWGGVRLPGLLWNEWKWKAVNAQVTEKA